MHPPPNLEDRIIFALDVPTRDEARTYVKRLSGLVSFYKVGWELFLATGLDFVYELRQNGLKVFLDLKLTPDIPEQLKRTAQSFAKAGIEFMTVHGNGKTIQMIRDARGDLPVKILSLTVLTSMDDQDLRDLYITDPSEKDSFKFQNVEEFVQFRAKESLENGADGLIASGLHASMLRQKFGNDFLLVCPGIRPEGHGHNEHKRAATPTQAIAGGADHLVIGRPIRDADDPRNTVEKILQEIQNAYQPA